jgi:ketol-acid reductoisomerase
VKVYYDKDADLNYIKNKKIAVIGFGSQGHAHAMNLSDSGCDVVVGLKSTSSSVAKAQKAGLKVLSVRDAAEQSEIVMILVPDEIAPGLYASDIAPVLRAGQYLALAHGFGIHFGFIKPPKDVNVFMVAPKGPGHLVRRQYQEGRGVPALIAIFQNPSKQAKKVALAWAKGIGGTRAGVIETSFKEETETDLFGEQAVLCGGASALVTAGYDTLVAAGYQPEMAYFECLHELKLIVDLMYEAGISGMRFSISDTAKYGDVVSGPRIINKAVRAEMKKVLTEIQNGKFARGWIKEATTGKKKKYHQLLKAGTRHPIEKTGARLRGLMPWIGKKNVGGAQAAY